MRCFSVAILMVVVGVLLCADIDGGRWGASSVLFCVLHCVFVDGGGCGALGFFVRTSIMINHSLCTCLGEMHDPATPSTACPSLREGNGTRVLTARG
jgi:hypothetical protein